MKGNVIRFDPDTNTGAISGHDGQRYDFATLDWHGQNRPHHGDVVDFTADGQRATQVYLIEPEYVAPSFGTFYFSASGRISRSQYWLRFILPYALIVGIVQGITQAAGPGSAVFGVFSAIYGLFSLVVIWPSFAILIKRIHDRNKMGWLALAIFIPGLIFVLMFVAWLAALGLQSDSGTALGIMTAVLGVIAAAVGIWVFIEFGCMRGTIGANKYGPDPVRPS